MGLRFRKSVTLCKGVKLNFGKTGMSLTLGTKGYHKTISTSGRVTTSVGIPGTGIYYTDTQNIGGNRGRSNTQRRRNRESISNNSTRNSFANVEGNTMDRYDDLVGMQSIYDTSETEEYAETPELTRSVDAPDDVDNYSQEQRVFSEIIDELETPLDWDYEDEVSSYVQDAETISVDDIERIFRYCDPTIEWTEIISGATAEELLMDKEVWQYCKTIAPQILQGNMDVYLQTIEQLRPVDDLLMYSGDFEFGTDKPDYMEVEFTHKADELLPGGRANDNFQKLIGAVSVRIARDLLALLPISKVIVHVVDDDVTVMSGLYDRATINKYVNGNLGIESFMDKFEHRINYSGGQYLEVERIQLG